MAHTKKIAPVDRKMFALELAEHFVLVFESLAGVRALFMTPARIASTPADELIGSLALALSYAPGRMAAGRGGRIPAQSGLKFRAMNHAADQAAGKSHTSTCVRD